MKEFFNALIKVAPAVLIVIVADKKLGVSNAVVKAITPGA